MLKLSWAEIGVCLGILLLLFALLMPAVQSSREEARKSTSKNNLKQIGLALHNYHDTWKCLPPGGIIREDDTAMNGWITMLMPFMEVSPEYARLDFDVPWNSLDNIVIFETPRLFFLNPSVEERFTNTGYALTHYLGNPNLFYRNSFVEFGQMKNGSAHTWMSGEIAGNFQPWAYPFNWRSLGTKLCDGPESFGFPAWNGGHLLLADGSVSFFSNKTSPEILKSFADAPPLATEEQTEAPAKIFQTGDYYWNRVDLQTESNEKQEYYANVLRNEAGAPLVIRVFEETKRNLTGEASYTKSTLPIFSFILQIDTTTDIAKALEGTTLFKAATPEQFQANVKTLQALQKQLQ